MIKEDTSRLRLRRFGITVGTVLLILGAVYWHFGYGRLLPILWGAGGGLIMLGLILPKALQPVEKVWMALAMVLAWFNTRIILTLVFYLVVTPIGLVMRVARDPLNRKLRNGSASYWIRRGRKPPDPGLYERQF